MPYAEIPKHLNFSHKGICDPVILRLEGGNDTGAFCITETKEGWIHIASSGELSEIRKQYNDVLVILEHYCYHADCLYSQDVEWFQLVIRKPTHQFAVSGKSKHISHTLTDPKTHMQRNLKEAFLHLREIFNRYYHVGDC